MTNQVSRQVVTGVISFLLVALLTACGNGKEATATTVPESSVSVTITSAIQQEIDVKLRSVGRVVSKNTPTLSAEVSARVMEVLVDEGEAVEQGQALVLLDTTTFELSRREASAEIERLQVSIANEERRVARYRDLKTKDVMPQERLDDAEAKLAIDKATLSAARARLAIADDRLSKTRLESPVDGVIEKRHVSVGDYVRVGGALVTVTDVYHLRAELPFPETVGHRLEVGQKLLIESPVAPGLIVSSTIDQVKPEIGLMSRAMVVLSDVQNPGSWRPDATIEAEVLVENRPEAVVVSTLSVVRRPAGEVVYTLERPDSQQVREQAVITGERLNGSVEILSGLDAGTVVVADGAHFLTEGARITVRESGQ